MDYHLSKVNENKNIWEKENVLVIWGLWYDLDLQIFKELE